MKSVLFICHGNICRSPMAEFIFKDLVRKSGVRVEGESLRQAQRPLRQAQRPLRQAQRPVSQAAWPDRTDWSERTEVLDAVRVGSAAVSYEEEGNDIYPPAKRTLNAHGIPFSRHNAHRISDAEASEYDVIVIMDTANKRLLSRILSPMNMSKVHMMMEYAGMASDVSDPWYTGDFEKTYRDITEGCKGLLASLMNEKSGNNL